MSCIFAEWPKTAVKAVTWQSDGGPRCWLALPRAGAVNVPPCFYVVHKTPKTKNHALRRAAAISPATRLPLSTAPSMKP